MIYSADIRGATAPVTPRQPRVAPQQPRVQPLAAPPALEPPWHVILLDDDWHTFEYVIEMLQVIFGHPRQLGRRMAEEVDQRGRVIVATVHKELAELRQQQIEGYGPDPKETNPQGQVSMKALIECSE
ncbi:ATP-dependent Clp protease adaptor ClpS [Prosthecobacter fluviatilis]|uniref:ATP-dependent Clp protease adaptor ClpS n=1 Tax=Prosthecobacter fluviatilis TaxID=445931 RepID=A0ABW0KJT7_9BACT